MPALLVLSVLLQFACLVHMVRTGRPYWWIWVILVGSFLGVAVYVVTQLIPDLGQDPRARRAAARVRRAVDPERERRRLEAQLAVADTIDNRLRVARESLELGDAEYAAMLFRSALKGPYVTDPQIMLGLAEAQFEAGDPAGARGTLEGLIAANPGFRSADGHLLYARSLEALGEHEQALKEYAVAAEAYPGEEGRYRHASLLITLGRFAEARAVLDEITRRERAAPRYYRRKEKPWLDEAKAALAKLGPSPQG